MFPPSIIPSLLCFVVLGISTSSAQGGNQTPWSSPESPYFRDYFMAGGSYTDDGTENGTHAFQGQMYVERLRPLAGANHSYPLVFIHGAGQTGTNFLNTPDGREGWASWLIGRGYEVYIIDQVARGRSMWLPTNGTMSFFSAETIEQMFTATQDFDLWPQAALHTQWPGTGRMGDPVFDAYYASTVQYITNNTMAETGMQAAGVALLDLIGPSILISHSQAGLFPWLWADARPELVKGILAIEPVGPPFQDAVIDNRTARAYGITDIPLTYDPPVTNTITPLTTETRPSSNPNRTSCTLQAEPARQLINLKDIPILVETSEASYHAVYDQCTVEFLRQAGAQAEHLRLEDVGIHGNGHMHFMEKNNLEIIEYLEEHWISTI
ncbi:alpha/beta-hydrolase [Stereum hirsutum FP-91666 SS1]|uniref:alpha/beta-hydrolase n=1 Tax=Stereum hirsutum (strain FP-91666) TaxID=721885 RepID=UPI000444A333|nr:alpha/beta-hydrolase [Stereum hirsutum FP-91666 SS1]EIM82128.1 alpha/beta-hydrolase [Stereum hirsutum FP-91666 SS1]